VRLNLVLDAPRSSCSRPFSRSPSTLRGAAEGRARSANARNDSGPTLHHAMSPHLGSLVGPLAVPGDVELKRLRRGLLALSLESQPEPYLLPLLRPVLVLEVVRPYQRMQSEPLVLHDATQVELLRCGT